MDVIRTAAVLALSGMALGLPLTGCVVDKVYVEPAAQALEPSERAEVLQSDLHDMPDYVFPSGHEYAAYDKEYRFKTPRRIQVAPGIHDFTVGLYFHEWYFCAFALDAERGHTYQPTKFIYHGADNPIAATYFQIKLTDRSPDRQQREIKLGCFRPT